MSEVNWFRPLSEDVTVPDMPKVMNLDQPQPKAQPDPQDVQEIEDQILRMAFGKAMKTIKRRTLAIFFLVGLALGFVGALVTLAVLILKAGV